VPHPALTPYPLGAHELANRFAVAPMTRVSAGPNGVPTVEMADYYAEFAEGGFPLVITEGVYPDDEHSQGYVNQPGLVGVEHVAGWQEVTRRVHGAGGRVIAQLMHAGALSQGSAYTDVRIAPSAVRPRGEMLPEYGGGGPWPVPRAMTENDVQRVRAAFVAAGRNAVAAGFDGVEVHAANGYLLDQFLTDYTNQREDRYGGSVAARVRLAAEIVADLRAALPDHLIGIRLSQTKVNDFTYRWAGGAADAEVIFTALAAAGADYLHVASEGRDWLETARLGGGDTITALAKRITGLPVIANGAMHQLPQAAEVIERGHADLLAVARGALANPDLPRRVAKDVPLEPFAPGMLEPMATIANTRLWREENGT
jgi:2,4-dienoyl-CoA reductase-like NADH-dependent reductase (Old Yellow Enzyme family)